MSAFTLIPQVAHSKGPFGVLPVFLHRQLLRFDLRAAVPAEGFLWWKRTRKSTTSHVRATTVGAAWRSLADLVAWPWQRRRRRPPTTPLPQRGWRRRKETWRKVERKRGRERATRERGAAGGDGGGMDNIRISLSAGNRCRRLRCARQSLCVSGNRRSTVKHNVQVDLSEMFLTSERQSSIPPAPSPSLTAAATGH